MPAQLETSSLAATGPSHETFTGEHADVSRSGDVFESGVHRIEAEEILNGPAYLRGAVRAHVYDVVHAAREDQFVRNEILLDAANINVHDTEHQDRDARVVAWLFDVFADKLDKDLREAALVGSMVHDRQYIPAAIAFAQQQIERIRTEDLNDRVFVDFQSFVHAYRPFVDIRDKWMRFLNKMDVIEALTPEESRKLFADGSFPLEIDKKALDPHAPLGEMMIRQWYDDPAFAEAFGDWSDAQKKVAAHTILHHSNGSDYNPLTARPEVQMLRLADKLDNTHHRIRDSMLTHASLQDPANCHRYVPASIRSYSLSVDRDAQIFTVDYNVDFEPFLALMHRDSPEFTYGKEEFRKDFQHAYGEKSMCIAAEVVHALFADKANGEMYSDTATFRVRFNFADGTQEEKTYPRMPMAPTYTERGRAH